MIARTTAYHTYIVRCKYPLHCLCIFKYLRCVIFKLRAQSLTKGHRLGCYIVHMWATLKPWENRLVYLLRYLSALSCKYHSTTRTTQCFMCCRSNYIKPIVKRVACHTPRNKSGNVCHVCYGNCPHLASNIYKLFVIKLTRVGRESCKYNLRLFLKCYLAQLIVINLTGIHVFHFVAHKVKHLIYTCCRVSMCKVPTML